MAMSEVHTSWFDGDRPREQLEAMVTLREHVDGLPETRQTFRRQDIDVSYHLLTREMMLMTGAWPMPEIYPGHVSQSGQRWVNPNYADRHLLPASWAQCACGTIITRAYGDGGNTLDGEHDHDNCKTYDRLRARADMLERREIVIKQALRHGVTGFEVSRQIGIEADSIGQITKELGISIREEREVYRGRAGNSYVALMAEGIDRRLIADAYDRCPSTLARYARRYTEYEWDASTNSWVDPTAESTVATKPDWLDRANRNREVADD